MGLGRPLLMTHSPPKGDPPDLHLGRQHGRTAGMEPGVRIDDQIDLGDLMTPGPQDRAAQCSRLRARHDNARQGAHPRRRSEGEAHDLDLLGIEVEMVTRESAGPNHVEFGLPPGRKAHALPQSSVV